MLNKLLKTFENDDLKKLANELIKTIPPYWYMVPASSTGKYHPDYALGDGGLMRHTIALVRIMNYLFIITADLFTSRERDLLRIAGIMHDSRKSGSQEDYEKNKYTKFEHPILAANVVREFKDKEWKNYEIELIAHSIESHMGQWNTDKYSSMQLPIPFDKYQYILHTCDYLASRKDILIDFTDWEPEEDNTTNEPNNDRKFDPNLDPNDYILHFGRHKGKTLREIKEEDPDYIKWAKESMYSEPAKLYIQLLE